jgi:peptidoglycan L-alanyl-D-glutamate endopeptidase CwlK
MALQKGDHGDAVGELQRRLTDAGFSPGTIDRSFGQGTEKAVLAFQKSERLGATGIADDETLERLKDATAKAAAELGELGKLTVSGVATMFPGALVDNIRRNLPVVLRALIDAELKAPRIAVMALATIRAETAGFVPLNEGISHFNTSSGGHDFDLYDNCNDLGNQGPPDGERFKGRGFVQLTGRSNYGQIGKELGLSDQLIQNPDRANEPDLAAKILACFIKDKLPRISAALDLSDLAQARKLVNGGSHGLKEFSEAFNTGMTLIA